jgi:MFS family permease
MDKILWSFIKFLIRFMFLQYRFLKMIFYDYWRKNLHLWIINAYFFGISFLWNSLHPLLLPAILLRYVSDNQKNTYLGLLTGAGLIIAMIVQPVAGAVSDRWASRWGRRRPLILTGTLLDMLFLGILAMAGGIPGLAIGYIGLQFTSNTAHGPAQGLLPDRVPAEHLGHGSAVKNALDMLGIIVASLLMGGFFHKDGSNWPASIGIVAAVLLVTMAITVFGTREESSHQAATGAQAGASLRDTFRIPWSAAPGYGLLILSRFVFLIGVYGVQAFAQYYIRDTLHVDNPVALAGTLMAVIAISLLVFALGSGWLCDRIGRKPVHIIAAVLVAAGSLLMITAHSANEILLYGGTIGAGIGVFLTSNWALATGLAPVEDAGKFLGLTNLATAGAGAISRLTGPALDWLNNRWPGAFYGYTALFLSSALFALLALLVLVRVPEPSRTRKEESSSMRSRPEADLP